MDSKVKMKIGGCKGYSFNFIFFPQNKIKNLLFFYHSKESKESKDSKDGSIIVFFLIQKIEKKERNEMLFRAS